jgi:transposase
MKSDQDPMATALEGDDRPAQVFTLTQSRALSDFTPQQIAACDQDIARVLGPFDSLGDPADHPFPPPTTAPRRPQRHEPAFALQTHLSRITGVDLTHVPG